MKTLFSLFLCVVLMGASADLQPQPNLHLPPVEIPVIDATEYMCLQKNIFYEARNQGEAGMIAVAAVTLNRTHDKRYPSTICEVVLQKRRGVCQFSWVCQIGFRMPRLYHPGDAKAWDQAGVVAVKMMSGRAKSNVGSATHYHATYVNPRWKLRYVTTIGDHKFFE